ncbi:MAG TPA: DUF2794 domain-containing protein [Kiloniellales bacterium]|jgi:hypothetical protein|nr:DUF2794 domain-containing protein [Kiloniellales bacterium]
MAGVVRLEEFRVRRRRRPAVVYFSRQELDQLLSLYSRRVATGEWRDYAIDHAAGCAFFSVFRHSYDRPLFSIAKRLRSDGKSTEFLLLAGHRQIASDGKLPSLLKRFEKKIKIVS